MSILSSCSIFWANESSDDNFFLTKNIIAIIYNLKHINPANKKSIKIIIKYCIFLQNVIFISYTIYSIKKNMSNFINIPSNNIICGLSASGKTYSFLRVFSSVQDQFSHGLLFCSTVNLNEDYSRTIKYFGNRVIVKEDYDETLIRSLYQSQHDDIAQHKKIRNQVFIILDDMVGLINFRNSIIDTLFTRSRHLGISIFVISQHMNFITPTMRINSHYVMITKIRDNNIDTLYELTSAFENKKELRLFLNKYCVNYQLIIFNELEAYAQKKYRVLKFVKD